MCKMLRCGAVINDMFSGSLRCGFYFYTCTSQFDAARFFTLIPQPQTRFRTLAMVGKEDIEYQGLCYGGFVLGSTSL